MIRGFNKADDIEKRGWKLESYLSPSIKDRPCIFLSHQHQDKPACREIAKYLSEAGIDYYLDIEDPALQAASASNDPVEITQKIKDGIVSSTHMMVVVSQKTYTSNWVPFEVGYGQAMLMDLTSDDLQGSKKLKLSILTLKDLAYDALPDYMHLAYEIRGANTLNGFIAKLLEMPVEKGIRENRMRENYKMGKVLNEVLEWSR